MNSTSKPVIVAIIPARYASTRLPAKPLIDLCGKPMILHVYERAKKARLLDRVIVATDHEKIVRAVHEFGGEAVMTPPELKSGSDRIAYVARNLSDVDLVVNIQGDEPLLVPEMIDQAIAPLINNKSILIGTLVKPITTSEEIVNPNIVKVVRDLNGFAIYFSRSPIPYLRDGIEIDRWHTQHIYFKHIGLYVFRKEVLLEFTSWPESTLERVEKLEQLRFIEHGYGILATLTDHDSIPIDVPADVERVVRLMNQSKQSATL